MAIAINTTNNYWNILKFLSNDIKLQLIAKLSNSLVASTKSEKISASRFYGAWRDEDFPMSSDELVKEIKASRKFKNDIEGMQSEIWRSS